MHYYQFNIADYRKDTQHLSPIEHYIYRELMDWYYLDETPIPKKTQLVIRRLRLVSENNQDLMNVLEEFFSETEEGWVHRRIDREIKKYQANAETARVNGSKGGRPKKPKKTQPVILANPEITQAKANHKPLTNNQEPIKKNVTKKSSRFKPPSLQDVIDYKKSRDSDVDPNRFVDFYMSKDWLVGKSKMKDWKAAFRNWESREGGSNGYQQPNQPSSLRKRGFAEDLSDTSWAESSGGDI